MRYNDLLAFKAASSSVYGTLLRYTLLKRVKRGSLILDDERVRFLLTQLDAWVLRLKT